ncbi:MAG TPA: aminotransferase class V-fold PLP-dependent enzyme [Edaphobacter sp.]|uniref:aminotransferase class V-fold PLP-dependent enzyme n=1 Tax=Edaphobacter sp. TaxID=1934404 RepID=UPI002B608467|nr:aminotransferase class V-fold PLP-dependent enzyme [Edaphobacter sp.]HUZ93817.1 aminotransferase class V-fold PLP-dependent enzyme [Edaphobacter sp.]
MKNESRWDAVRRDFPMHPAEVYLAGFWISTPPQSVRDAIAEFREDLDLCAGRSLMRNQSRLVQESTSALSAFLGVGLDEVAITSSATEGLTLLYGGLSLEPGSEILISEHDHYSMVSAARKAAARTGCAIRTMRLYENGEANTPERLIEGVRAAITTRTRVLGLTWVHSCTGVKLPVREICRNLEQGKREGRVPKDLLIILDATHGVGAVNARIGDLGVDLAAASCHKWLNGPRGTGFICGRRAELERLSDVIPTYGSNTVARVMGMEIHGADNPAERLTPGGFKAFEHRWAIGPAIRYMASLGMETIEDRLTELSRYLKDGLAALPGVHVITPHQPELSAGLVCIDIDGHTAEEASVALAARQVIALSGPYKRSHLRFSPFIYNSFEELDRAIAAVGAISRPRR